MAPYSLKILIEDINELHFYYLVFAVASSRKASVGSPSEEGGRA